MEGGFFADGFELRQEAVVVHRRGVDVGYLLVESAFAGADFAHAFRLFLKVFIGEVSALFLACVVHYPAFDGVFAGDGVDPFAELKRTLGVDFKAHRYHHLQAVVVNAVCFVVAGSYPKNSDN